MSEERKIIVLLDDGERFDTWSHWKSAYIEHTSEIIQHSSEADLSTSAAVFYVREPDSAVLSPALSLLDRKLTQLEDGQPKGTRRVNFVGYLNRANANNYPSFTYHPNGYEVPPEEDLYSPLTLDSVTEYPKYYTDSAEGYAKLKAADFDGYRLADKRAMMGGKYNDAWAITRGPRDSREVLLPDASWVPVDSVGWRCVNDYPKFSFEMRKALDLIRSFIDHG